MKARRQFRSYKLDAEKERRLRTAAVGRRIRVARDTVCTVLESPDSVYACFDCIFFAEFTHTEKASVCPKFRLCNAKDRPDCKSVYFRNYVEK